MFLSSVCALIWIKSDCITNQGERKGIWVYNIDLVVLRFTCEGIYTSLLGFVSFFSSLGGLSLLNNEYFIIVSKNT